MKLRSEHRFLFLFAAPALSSRIVHFVARFSPKSAANCAARYRVGAFHDGRSRLRGALAYSIPAVGGGFCLGRNRFSSGCGCGYEYNSPAGSAAPDRQHSGRRKPVERRHSAGGVAVCSRRH